MASAAPKASRSTGGPGPLRRRLGPPRPEVGRQRGRLDHVRAQRNYQKIPLCTASVVPSEETESMCGRPLGLQFFAKTGDLYIADA